MGFLDETVSKLRDVLATLESIDLWPPWDAVQTIVNAVAEAVAIATRPPEPTPENIDDAAAAWRRIGSFADAGCEELGTCATRIDTTAWQGESGDAFRTSLGRLKTRSATVGPAARGVASALTTLSAEMTDARSRHQQADNTLRQNLEISWTDLLPWEAVDYLKGILEGVITAVTEAIGAYQDAADAVRAAKRAIEAAMDEIDLPDHLPGGVSPVSAVNGWEDEKGPLSGAALEKYDDAYAGLPPAEQRAVDQALANAKNDDERAWIMAGVASGLTGQALANYLKKLHGLTPSQLDGLNPPTDGSYEQPDQTTCGSSSLVMSKMLNDPAYALWMETGYDPETGQTDPRTPEQRFADESQRMHLRTNLPTDRDGDLQFPWPPQLGTQPWALAQEMSSEGGSGVPGRDYGVNTVPASDRGSAYDQIQSSVEDGNTVPLYVGDDTRPGHVVLVTGSDGDSLTIYDPADGSEHTIPRDDFTSGNLNVSGWDEPWFSVTPS